MHSFLHWCKCAKLMIKKNFVAQQKYLLIFQLITKPLVQLFDPDVFPNLEIKK